MEGSGLGLSIAHWIVKAQRGKIQITKPMISRSTGDVIFKDLRILAQAVLPSSAIQKSHALPLPGWVQQFLGIHDSEHGSFEVEAVSDAQQRVQMLLLTHSHPFYQPDTPEDAERRAFHEGIIDSDLSGQREFSWGAVLCRLDTKASFTE